MDFFNQKEIDSFQKQLETLTNYFYNKMESPTMKPDNNVPKSIKGDYDLSIHGNKIVLVDNVDGTTVEAKCHPDDNFDIGIGIKEAFKKMNEKREEEYNKIKVGDYVEVVNPGQSYTTIADLFKENEISKYAPYYRYGVVPVKGVNGRVVFVDKYNHVVFQTSKDTAYGDERYGKSSVTDGVYVVGKYGLRKVKKIL